MGDIAILPAEKKAGLNVFQTDMLIGENYEGTAITDLIEGYLEVIEVKSESMIRIQVVDDDDENIVVLNAHNLNGINVIPIRLQTMDVENVPFSFGTTRWVFKNSKLRIRVQGSKNSKVSIKLTWWT